MWGRNGVGVPCFLMAAGVWPSILSPSCLCHPAAAALQSHVLGSQAAALVPQGSGAAQFAPVLALGAARPTGVWCPTEGPLPVAPPCTPALQWGFHHQHQRFLPTETSWGRQGGPVVFGPQRPRQLPLSCSTQAGSAQTLVQELWAGAATTEGSLLECQRVPSSVRLDKSPGIPQSPCGAASTLPSPLGHRWSSSQGWGSAPPRIGPSFPHIPLV